MSKESKNYISTIIPIKTLSTTIHETSLQIISNFLFLIKLIQKNKFQTP